ncbi:MAG: hypothetical protein ACI87E_003656, partial [Mariniblastus sp.]
MDQNTNKAESENLHAGAFHSASESPSNDLDWSGTPDLQTSLAAKAEKSQRPSSSRKRKN